MVDLAIQLPPHSPEFGGLLGQRIAIGSSFEAHILIAGLVSGASQLGPITEWVGYMRRRPEYDRLAHGIARFLVYYFSIGAAIAILVITALLTGLWGSVWAIINRVGFWPFFIEAWTFFLMVVGSYLWYYTWDLLRDYKGLHMAFGGLLAVASFVQVMMIDVIASYMLTPSQPNNPLRVFLNPTEYPLQIHRTVANLAYMGFAVAAFAGFRYLRSKDAAKRAFFDWAGSYGMIWGIGMTLMQPIVGYSYAKEIQLHAYGAWYKMMQGTLSSEFLGQIFLLGLMFLAGSYYFWRRLHASNAPNQGLLGLLTVLLAVTTVFATLPAHLAFTYNQVLASGKDRPFWEGGWVNPFAAMIPYKVGALIAYSVFAIAGLYWYLRGQREVVWGTARAVEQWVLIASVFMVAAMIVLMGFIRENSRYPDVIAGQVQLSHQQVLSQQLISPVTGLSGTLPPPP